MGAEGPFQKRLQMGPKAPFNSALNAEQPSRVISIRAPAALWERHFDLVCPFLSGFIYPRVGLTFIQI